MILLMIGCSAVAYASSVSVMMTPPSAEVACSVTATPADVSAIMITIYGEYPQTAGKGNIDFPAMTLSASVPSGGGLSRTVSGENDRTVTILPVDEGNSISKPGECPPSTVPEPGTLLLIVVGVVGLSVALRSRG